MSDYTLAPGIDPQFASVHERFFRTTTAHDLVSANATAFARVLKRQRDAFGVSQREAAAMCGVGQFVIFASETELRIPTALTLSKLMEGLGIAREDIEAEVWALADEQAVSHEAA